MRKILSIVLFFFVGLFALTNFSPQEVSAAAPAPTAVLQQQADPVPTGGYWVVDPEVTFIGKNARRAGLMLDWTLQNYNWVCVNRIANRQCDDTNNPLAKFWSLIVISIVVPLLFFVILATSLVIIITRGRSLTIMRFIPRFVAVILLIVFSYAILQFLYQITDLIQGFFLKSNDQSVQPCPPNCISQADLLYVGWDYRTFVGLRLLGDYNSESAFISLLLTKLTALTYFVMVGILIMRKIILWFFIIVSPIFPLLLLYYPTRNTGKIWIGEFFRWLLYAPLFAIFLKGLVFMWRERIPLVFTPAGGANVIGDPSQIIFPTAVNILLGGPQQFVTPTNSVNLTETFALYVVALIMLWIVILLPWILLQIFLDYAANFAPGDSAVMKTLVNMATNNKPIGPNSGGGSQPPTPPGDTGAALNLPFAKRFSIPDSMKHAGEAKQIPIGMAETATSQVAFLPTAQINAQALSATNVSVPSLRDIAKYETALLSKDSSRQREVVSVRENLERIANPVSTSNVTDQRQFSNIRSQLSQQSQQGNIIASSILKAANTVSDSKATNSQIKNVMQQMANPALASGVINQKKMSSLHEMLTKESKQNNNKIATSLLSVNDKTSAKELEKIHDQLMQTKETTMSSAVLSTISGAVSQTKTQTQVKNVIQQVSNPASASSPVDREKLTKLKDSLTKASKDGNELASSILSVNSKTSTTDIEKLQQRILDAKAKGEPVASAVAEAAQKTVTLPMVNRIQSVTQEDYKAIRDMWKENYQKLEVPDGMAGTRDEWIKDDIGKIDSIMQKLKSSDQEVVQEGMDAVSDILPFLMVGGFSQSEIVGYLQAKQDAAKEVSAALAKDEEESVSVSTQKAQAEKSMSASMEDTSSSSSASSSSDDDGYVPPTFTATSTTNQNISNEIMAMVDLKIPKMRDIVRYETRALSTDKTQAAGVQKAHEVLEKIASPEKITDTAEKAKYEKLREKLETESKAGNVTARVLLHAAAGATKSPVSVAAPVQAKSILQQIANPTLATTDEDKKRFSDLHDKLTQAGKDGNELANAVLATQDATSAEDIEKLQSKLTEAKAKGESVATDVLSHMTTKVSVPKVNELQTVTPEEYSEVKKLWKENYQKLEVPQGMAGSREEWMKDDIKNISDIVAQLTSTDQETVQKGLDAVSNVLPFLLMGGFSQDEIIAYLKAKQEAAQEVLTSAVQEEASQVSVSAPAAQPTAQAAAASLEPETVPGTEQIQLPTPAQNITMQQPSALVQESGLSVPSLKDLASYETKLLSKDATQTQEITKITEILTNIANPAPLAAGEERTRYEDLRERLVSEGQKGDPSAQIILTAAELLSGEAQELSATLADIKDVLAQVANTSLVPAEGNHDFYTRLHDYLSKESEQQNALATALLAVTPETSAAEIEKLKAQLLEANQQNNPVASQVFSAIGETLLVKKLRKVLATIHNPEKAGSVADQQYFAKLHDSLTQASTSGDDLATLVLSVQETATGGELQALLTRLQEDKEKKNHIAEQVLASLGTGLVAGVNTTQPVSEADYAEVKKMWEETYRKFVLADGFPQGDTKRREWIQTDINTIDQTLTLLHSDEKAKRDEGLKQLTTILPFVLLGGFSFNEMLAYLQTKRDAAVTVLPEIQSEEESTVEVSGSQPAAQERTAAETPKEKK